MPKQVRLNAFEMNCVAHQSPGLWRHPRDRSRDYRRLDGWIELARTLERGLFDGLFLADVLGVYDVYGGGPEAALRHATQTPVNDPLLLIPAMAAATKHLGFGVTVTLSYEPPFPFARRMSTLDHLTDGRIGWNIVTGYLDSAAKGMGEGGQRKHDDRFSNRPFWVKRFQTIRRFSVDVAHGLALLFGIGTKALPLSDSRMRWSNLCSGLAVRRNGRSKRTCELTSSIVPRGTSFHRSVELDVPPIAFDSARSSCRHGFPGPAELGAVHPDAVHDHSQPTR